MSFPLFPPQASSVAPEVDALYWYLVGICGLVLLGILLVITVFLFRYRRGRPADRRLPRLPVRAMELSWTLIPLLIFLSFFVWGARVYHRLQDIPEGALEINVIGRQWMWKLQHPSGRREINELHVPAGRPIRLTLASQDVIHSFFIPAFRVKQDVVPGRYTTAWFEATRPGTYHLFCAEYCGKDHSRMRGQVFVLPPEEYERWLTQGESQPTLTQSGERLFRDLGCSGCHVGSTIVRAPPLEGLFGRPVPLQNGQVVLADERYLHDSIYRPELEIAAGYEPVMPLSRDG